MNYSKNIKQNTRKKKNKTLEIYKIPCIKYRKSDIMSPKEPILVCYVQIYDK